MIARGFAPICLLAIAGFLTLKYVAEVSGEMWVTFDRSGRQTAFDIPPNHPAFRARGEKAMMWRKTEYFVEKERKLRVKAILKQQHRVMRGMHQQHHRAPPIPLARFQRSSDLTEYQVSIVH